MKRVNLSSSYRNWYLFPITKWNFETELNSRVYSNRLLLTGKRPRDSPCSILLRNLETRLVEVSLDELARTGSLVKCMERWNGRKQYFYRYIKRRYIAMWKKRIKYEILTILLKKLENYSKNVLGDTNATDQQLITSSCWNTLWLIVASIK